MIDKNKKNPVNHNLKENKARHNLKEKNEYDYNLTCVMGSPYCPKTFKFQVE